MKICPVCQTEYEDDSMQFCTKDGTTLDQLAAPEFTNAALPSEAVESIRDTDDDFEATVIRPQTPPIIISTAAPETQSAPPAPPRVVEPSKKSNAGLYAVVGILLAAILLVSAGVIGLYFYFNPGKKQVAGVNSNANQTTKDNSASNNSTANVSDSNANTANTNFNSNANARPSPSPSPSPSPRPSPSPSPKNANSNLNANTVAPSPAPSVAPPPAVPSPAPSPAATPPQVPRTVAGGVMNGKATSLPKPPYPATARQARAQGQVNVQILVDENGSVVSANAISGNPLLRQAAQSAARQAKFPPTVLSGQAVKVSGVIVYNFTLQQ